MAGVGQRGGGCRGRSRKKGVEKQVEFKSGACLQSWPYSVAVIAIIRDSA